MIIREKFEGHWTDHYSAAKGDGILRFYEYFDRFLDAVELIDDDDDNKLIARAECAGMTEDEDYTLRVDGAISDWWLDIDEIFHRLTHIIEFHDILNLNKIEIINGNLEAVCTVTFYE